VSQGDPVLYFAYGSNMRLPRIEARLGVCEVLGSASLKGYNLRFHKRGADASGKCNAYKTADGRQHVWGGLYKLSNSQAQRLDEFEGQGYLRRRINLSFQYQAIEAYTYVALSQWIDEQLLPFDWYRALVIQGAIDFGLSSSYVRRLSAFHCEVDPQPSRRRSQLMLATQSSA